MKHVHFKLLLVRFLTPNVKWIIHPLFPAIAQISSLITHRKIHPAKSPESSKWNLEIEHLMAGLF